VWPIAFTFIVPFVVATISSAAVVGRPGSGLGEPLPSDSEVEAVGTFPDSNPNPVLRMAASGVLLNATPASAELIRALRTRIGVALPPDLVTRLGAAANAAAIGAVHVEAAGRTYRLKAVAIGELGFINIYGSQVTDVEVVRTSAAYGHGRAVHGPRVGAHVRDVTRTRVGGSLPFRRTREARVASRRLGLP